MDSTIRFFGLCSTISHSDFLLSLCCGRMFVLVQLSRDLEFDLSLLVARKQTFGC
jgi:hypothetical protein